MRSLTLYRYIIDYKESVYHSLQSKIYYNICIELNFAFIPLILLVVLNEILHNYTFFYKHHKIETENIFYQ